MQKSEFSCDYFPMISNLPASALAMGATSNANVSMEERNHNVNSFGQYVVQRLYRQTDDLKRHKHENAIHEAIAKAEKELF